MPPLFAPAHELARQIHVINAYCREAELLEDPMQITLWDLLDELIDAHERVAPKSLFAGECAGARCILVNDCLRHS